MTIENDFLYDVLVKLARFMDAIWRFITRQPAERGSDGE